MRVKLHDLLAGQAAQNRSRPAITYKNTTYSYGELWDAVGVAAGGLVDLGLSRGDRVAIFLEKRIETVVSIFAVSLAGGVFVPINPALRPHQVGHIVRDCDVSLLVTSKDRLHTIAGELGGCPSVRAAVLVDEAESPAAGDRPFTVAPWSALSGGPRLACTPHDGVDYDVAAILYTSGSTGSPKGVVLSHRNLLVGAESVSSYIGNDCDDVILSVLPLSFDAGFSQITTAFSVGASVVLMNYLLPGDVAKLCARHQVTGMTCVPPLWNQIVGVDWGAEAASGIRYFANTGGRMPKSTLDKLRSIFPTASPFLMYGLTEAFRSTFLDPAEVDRRPDSIGKAIPNAEILVVRPDGTVCDPGEPGELVHRGPLVAMGYWNDPERTAQRFKPAPGFSFEWRPPEMAVWSGDQVIRDEEGFLYFVGRDDEMIKTSGYRVSPTEIEEVAYSSGMVGDAVALGVPDDDLGQRIVLIVSPAKGVDLDPARLLDVLRRELPSYMLPAIDARESLPRSPNGKLDRAVLRAELIQ